MAKRYIVDLRSLDPAKRQAAFDQIDRFSFMTSQILGPTGLEGADVIWDLNENFATSPALPVGCVWREV